MQYSPKLKVAMEEIKEILRKHDIAGLVALHTPGFSEYLMKIDPSYSCAKFDTIEGKAGVRIRARLEEDYAGDKEAHEKALTDTSNMFKLLGKSGGVMTLAVLDVSDDLDKQLDVTHFDDDHTGHVDQNN
jgi:hypothetical protein